MSPSTPAFIPDSLDQKLSGLNPSIVHFHWVSAGFLRIETLGKLTKPLVWTLHDSWAFTGGCHYPFDCTRYHRDCGACPILGSSRERDLTRRIWSRKQKAWEGLNLTVVTPSRWLADCARVKLPVPGDTSRGYPKRSRYGSFLPHRARHCT